MSNAPTDWLKDNSGGTGGPGVYFGAIGDKVVGEISATPRRVETEFGERLVVELKAADGCTAQSGTNGEDGPIKPGDEVTLWVKPGAMAAAISKAIGEAGAAGLSDGDTLAVAYSGDGERRKPGWNPPKLYVARYTPAKAAVSVENLV